MTNAAADFAGRDLALWYDMRRLVVHRSGRMRVRRSYRHTCQTTCQTRLNQPLGVARRRQVLYKHWVMCSNVVAWVPEVRVAMTIVTNHLSDSSLDPGESLLPQDLCFNPASQLVHFALQISFRHFIFEG